MVTIGLYDGLAYRFRLRNENAAGAEDIVLASGRPGLTSVVGDFDGDGGASIGMFGGDGLRFYLREGIDAFDREFVVRLGSRVALVAPGRAAAIINLHNLLIVRRGALVGD